MIVSPCTYWNNRGFGIAFISLILFNLPLTNDAYSLTYSSKMNTNKAGLHTAHSKGSRER